MKVSRELFDLLITHPVFQNEPKAINTVQYWLTAIDAATERNDGRPVTWGHKDIQDRFRSHEQSHTTFRDVLRDLGLINFTTYRPPANESAQGECRKFEITPKGRRLTAGGNFQWLYHLLKDPKIRRKNQIAVSVRKARRRRLVHTDAMCRIIDVFRHKVKFERDGLLKQLASDKARAPGRFSSALHLLLAFETRKFCELEVKEGRIFYEFVGLPREYRPFALFNRKPYVAILDIRACHPTFLGRFLRELYQKCMDESLAPSPDERVLMVRTKLNQVNVSSLDKECQTWTYIFTNREDPRDWIMKKAGISISSGDMKQCLNRWLNGGKEYEREADGKRNRKDNQRLEAWFVKRFPEMAKVWAAVEDRGMTGNLIADAYELPLMLNPALYAFADGLGLMLAYEYDGVGVFATRDDPELPAKLEKVCGFIQRQSAKEFAVPVAVKGVNGSQSKPRCLQLRWHNGGR